MAYELLKTKSINITASFATKQYTFVKLDTNGTLATPSAGGMAIGVIQDNPNTAGNPGAVCFPGDITKVKVGTGGITAGGAVSTDGNGCAVAWTSGAMILGYALFAAAVGGLGSIIYQPTTHTSWG
jgi:hypothetical protein